jgi:hypothetical protein
MRLVDRFARCRRILHVEHAKLFAAQAMRVEADQVSRVPHSIEKKARAGIGFTIRGRLSAALDARGASMGALAMMAFALIVWKEVPSHHAVLVLAGAIAAWAALAGTPWRLRRWHTRIWIRRRAQGSR